MLVDNNQTSQGIANASEQVVAARDIVRSATSTYFTQSSSEHHLHAAGQNRCLKNVRGTVRDKFVYLHFGSFRFVNPRSCLLVLPLLLLPGAGGS